MMENSDEVLLELIRFGAAGERIGGEISPVLESYLQYVARSGDTVFSWQRLMPLFKCKLDRAIDQFVRETPVDKVPAMPNVEPFQFGEMRSEMHQAIDSMGGTPFTIQRLCELVTDPYRYYKRVDKYMRGVEKNIRVVSVIDHHRRSRDVVNGDCDMDEHAAVTTSRHSNGSLAVDQCSTDGVTSSMSPSDDVNGSSRQSPSPELPGVDSMLCAMSEHNSDVFAEANSSSSSSNNNSGNIIDNAVVSDTTPALPGTLSTTADSNNISSGGSGVVAAAEDGDSGVCSSLTVGAAVQAVDCGPAAEAASQSDAMETCDDEALPIVSATVADSPVSSDAAGSGCGTPACDATAAGALAASAAAAAVSSSQLVSPSASSPPPVSAATAGGATAANTATAGGGGAAPNAAIAAGGGGAVATASAVAAPADGSDITTAGIIDTTCSVLAAASAAPSDASGVNQFSAAAQSDCHVSSISVTADASSVSSDPDTLTAAPTVPAASDVSDVAMDTECLPVDSSFDQSSTINDSKIAPTANCGESAVQMSVDCPAGVPTRLSLPAAHTSSAASSSSREGGGGASSSRGGGGGGASSSDCEDAGCIVAASCCDAAADDANLSCSSDMSLEHSLCDDSGAAGVATEATGSTGGEPGDQSSCQVRPAALVVAAAQSHEVSDDSVSAAATAAAAADGVAATDAGAVTATDVDAAAANAVTTTAGCATTAATADVAADAADGAAGASDITTAAAASGASGGAAGSAQSHTTDQLATTPADSSCDRHQSFDRAS